jgi:hypothetical protein
LVVTVKSGGGRRRAARGQYYVACRRTGQRWHMVRQLPRKRRSTGSWRRTLQCGGEVGAAGPPSNRHAAWSRLLLELHPSVIGDSVIKKNKERRQLKIFLTQIGPTVPLTSDPPVICFWEWIGWKDYEVPKKRNLESVSAKKRRFFSPTPSIPACGTCVGPTYSSTQTRFVPSSV